MPYGPPLCGKEYCGTPHCVKCYPARYDGSLRLRDRLQPPGSDEAVHLGCTCPVMDNSHGRGRGIDGQGRRTYIVYLNCPVHGGKGQE